jgi:hypothetical protein
VLYYDGDGDGYGDDDLATDRCFPGEGYVEQAGDCDDLSADIHPGAEEICNDIDDNCARGADEESAGLVYDTWYLDVDGDGWGNTDYAVIDCAAPLGYAARVPGDCDDSRADVNPDAEEVCSDGIDNDCDGAAACRLDGDAVGAEAAFARIIGIDVDQGIGSPLVGLGDVDGDGGEDFAVMSDGDLARGDCRIFRGGLAGTRTTSSATLSISSDSLLGDVVYSSEREAFILGDSLRFSFAGALQVVSAGADGSIEVGDDTAVRAGTGEDAFGAALAISSSADPSGAERLLVGAYGDSSRAESAGRAEILTSSLDTIAVIRGTEANDLAGISVDVLPDLDGDGLDDIAIVAAGADGTYRGQLGIFLSPLSGEVAYPDADLLFWGQSEDEYFAYSVTGGDLDGDGYNDLVLSAPGVVGALSGYPAYVYGISGPFDDIPAQAHPSAIARTLTLQGYGGEGSFGQSLATGDFDGDGALDLAIGAGTTQTEGSTAGNGAAYLLYGRFDLTSGAHVDAQDADGAFLTGEIDSGERFGWSVAALHLNHDDLSDLLVGAVLADPAAARDAGTVYAFLGEGL